MKHLFVPAKYKHAEVDTLQLKNLPKKLAIVYSIQYLELAKKIQDVLRKTHKISSFSQVLGCSKVHFKEKAVLLVGSGRFHALNLVLQGYDVYIYNSSRITKEELEALERERKSARLNFLSAEEKAILVSTKPGQYNLKQALALKEKHNAIIFLADNINIAELENFSPQGWVNTACPTLIYDSLKIINPEEI